MNQAVATKGMPWWAWLLIGLAVLVMLMGVFAGIAVFGLRKYLIDAKSSEAQHVVPTLASAIARCATSGLPPSSRPVPSVAPPAKKYLSAPSDWSGQEAFRCAGFALSEPQYFSYQWQAESASRGVVIALADLDGDGTPELRFEQTVECASASACAAGPLRALQAP